MKAQNLLLPFWLTLISIASGQVYQESGGLVVMEAENSPSNLGQWIRINQGQANYVSGASNNSHIEFTGNSPSGGSANSPLTYTFKINSAGTYRLRMRARKRLDGAASDLCNDAYVKMSGNFAAANGGGYKSLLTSNTKFFGGNAGGWGWAEKLDDTSVNPDVKYNALYVFNAGESYTLTVSGRSQRFNIDRIILHKTSLSDSAWQNATESSTTPGGGGGGGGDLVLDATSDFPTIDAGQAPYYVDSARDALAINAGNLNNRDKFARATTGFNGTTGTYDITITSLGETDGECSFRLLVNGSVIGTRQNTRVTTDYGPQYHTFTNVSVPTGATLAVESNAVSNGLIPEGDGFAYARGRWTTLTLSPSGEGGGTGGGSSGDVVSMPAGRIAYSADGNEHDRDDIGATPMSLFILHIAGLGDRLVHYEYSNHLGANTTSQEQDMEESALGSQSLYGYPRDIFFSGYRETNAAAANLTTEINKSTAQDPLFIIAAGPMETVYRGMNAANQSARQHVTLISHSTWNENHNDTAALAHTWNDLKNLPGGAVFKDISDQNGNSGPNDGNDMNTQYSEWTWMENSSDPKARWVWDRMKVAFNGKADPSDAGMMWYLITGLGDEGGNSAKIKDLYDNPPTVVTSLLVDAGSDQVVTNGAAPFHISLAGGASGEEPGETITYQWSKLDGPGTVDFADANAATTSAQFSDAGYHELQLSATVGGVSVSDTLTVIITPDGTRLPWGGVRSSIPGRIEMEHYDHGGEGLGYLDSTPERLGPLGFRDDEAVDLQGAGTDNYRIGFATVSERLDYSVRITKAGLYQLRYSAGCIVDDALFRIDLDGAPLSGRIAPPNTGDNGTLAITEGPILALPAGDHLLSFFFDQSYFSPDWIEFEALTAPSGGEVSYEPVDDAYTQNGTNNNIGVLRIENSGRTRISYLKFDLSDLSGSPSSAILRLTEGDDVSSGVMTLRLSSANSNDWDEATVSGATAPATVAELASYTGNVTDGAKIEFDLTSSITSPSIYSFILETDASEMDVSFVSKEGASADRPMLIVTSPSNQAPTFPGYSASALSGGMLQLLSSDILSTATDPDGDSISLVPSGGITSRGGSLSVTPTGFQYTPPAAFVGDDSFPLHVVDEKGSSTSGNLSLTVYPSDGGIETMIPPTMNLTEGGSADISFTGLPGIEYVVLRSTDLSDWQEVGRVIAGWDGSASFSDPTPPDHKAFYTISTP